MSGDPQLFDTGPGLPPGAPAPKDDRSYGQRLTERRNKQIADGTHPTTLRPLLEGTEESCGSCEHHFVRRLGGTYHKCVKAAGGVTGGPKSDVRVSWPACELWEAVR